MEENGKKGVVTAIKFAHNPLENTYNVIAEKVQQLRSDSQYELLDSLRISGAKTDRIGQSDEDYYNSRISELIKGLEMGENIGQIDIKNKPYEGVAARIMPELAKAAERLARAFISGAPIVVRFHNDGDGSAGGIAIYRALSEIQGRIFESERNVSWQINKGIAYTTESFFADSMLFESYKSVERPLLVITDFGTTPDSVDAIKAARGVCDIIWLDHHTPYEGFPREMINHYINVFDFGGDSNFTAGLLTCMFSQVIARIDLSQLREASLVSDYSAYANRDDKRAARDAAILDYLTSNRDDLYSKPKQMDAVLRNDEKADETFRYALGLLEEAIKVGVQNIRRYSGTDGINICVLDFGCIAKLNIGYPLPGRYSSRLQYTMETLNKGNTITLVYYGSYISMRASNDTREHVNLLEIIDRIARSTSNAVSGGGHLQAATIKAGKGNIDDVLKLLLIELGVRDSR